MKRIKFTIVLLLSLLSIVFTSCADNTPDTTKGQIIIKESRVTFTSVSSTIIVSYTAQGVNEIACSAPASWIKAEAKNGSLTLTAEANPNQTSRATMLTLQGGGAKKTISIFQDARVVDGDGLGSDLKVTVKGATATSVNGTSTIEKTFDGDYSTIYHSNYANSGTGYFPITLTYNFENVPSIDYLIYYPRTSGNNGLFKKFDLYISTAEESGLKKYGEYDFGGSSSPSRIVFSEPIKNPKSIQFVVKSGTGDGQGYATCAEMEFFRANPDNFDYLTIFTDHSCSELKSGITEAAIQAIDNKFFKSLALELLHGDYNTEFRIQDYRAWQHPNVMANINKTSTYSLRDNPTGISANKDEQIIVMVNDTKGQNISIFIQDPDDKISGTSYSLGTGINKFKAKNEGLMYIMYHTPTAEEEPIRINIITGTVNGYFDRIKHKKEDWKRILDSAPYKRFDLVGQYAHLSFETDAFRRYTPDGLALIEKYDEMVLEQQEFMGLVKYNKMFKNRAYFLVVYGDAYMYATGNYMGFHSGTQKDILDVKKFVAAPWGPAHELGHINQTRPGLKWAGMAEVTNNIHSLHIQTLWGNKSRQESDDRYNKGFASILVPSIAHNKDTDPFKRLIPFWQLKLYMHDVLGKKEFYKDIYEDVRNKPNPTDHGVAQLDFVKRVCDIAQMDFTDLFAAWGFFTPIDIEIDDYGKSQFTITQAQIDACKTYIANKGYAKPAHAVHYITDSTVPFYKDNKAVKKGTASYSNAQCQLSGWDNVVVFEAYKQEKLYAVTTKTTIPLSGSKADYKVYAISANGEKVEVQF